MSISPKMSLFMMLLVISNISALPVPTKDTSSDLATTSNDTTSESVALPVPTKDTSSDLATTSNDTTSESEEGGLRGGGRQRREADEAGR